MSKSNSHGTKLIVDGVEVGAVNTFNGIKITAETIDVTAFDSAEGYREKISGYKDTENPTAGGFLDGDDEGQDKCLELLDSGDVVPIEVRFPPKIGKSWTCQASVVVFSTNAELGNAIKFEAEFAVSGKPSLDDTPLSTG